MLGGIGNTSQMMSQLFSRIDTKGQGFIEKSDLTSAFSAVAAKSGSNSGSTSVDDVFSALDTDSDGKVTESEFSSTLSKLKEELDNQFGQMRMQGQGGHGGPQGMSGNMPPLPPPPQNDSGFTQDELQSQLDEIGSSDSQQSNLISNIVNNFEAADTDGDGKVSFTEAMAYEQSSQSTATDSTSSTSTSTSSASASNSDTTSSSNSDAQILRKIMELMHAYGNSGEQNQSASVNSLLSIMA